MEKVVLVKKKKVQKAPVVDNKDNDEQYFEHDN